MKSGGASRRQTPRHRSGDCARPCHSAGLARMNLVQVDPRLLHGEGELRPVVALQFADGEWQGPADLGEEVYARALVELSIERWCPA